jgi:hypothetical protein
VKEYIYNVLFIADYFTLTVYINLDVDDITVAENEAVELMQKMYGFPVFKFATEIEVEYC